MDCVPRVRKKKKGSRADKNATPAVTWRISRAAVSARVDRVRLAGLSIPRLGEIGNLVVIDGRLPRLVGECECRLRFGGLGLGLLGLIPLLLACDGGGGWTRVSENPSGFGQHGRLVGS
jgi:hypothetical protein